MILWKGNVRSLLSVLEMSGGVSEDVEHRYG
jgi:hypothetical protein